jgi:hypothetical protein
MRWRYSGGMHMELEQLMRWGRSCADLGFESLEWGRLINSSCMGRAVGRPAGACLSDRILTVPYGAVGWWHLSPVVTMCRSRHATGWWLTHWLSVVRISRIHVQPGRKFYCVTLITQGMLHTATRTLSADDFAVLLSCGARCVARGVGTRATQSAVRLPHSARLCRTQ